MELHISYWLEASVFILVGVAAAIPLLLLNVRVAPKLGLIDWPKARGVTEEQIPIVGHSLVIISISTLCVLMQFYDISPWFLTTALVMAVMGHFDDRKPLPALDKMFFQIVCVSAVVLLDPSIRDAMTLKFGRAGTFWGIFFILGLINAVNFVDGIDGLAGLVILIGAAGFIFLSRPFPDRYPYFVHAAVIIGSLIPFLYLNVMKRKGFLGNVGSYFFSYVLAMMHLSLPLSAAGPVSRLSLSALCFLIPVADAIMVLTTRVFTRRSPFQADKGHLHHRLIQTSISLRYILLNFGMIEVAALGVAVLLAENTGIRDSFLPMYILASHTALAAILIYMIEKASKRRVQAYLQRLDTGEPIYFLKYEFKNADGTPISMGTLRRLEARVSAEIRVTDLCYLEKPCTLFVTLKTLPEPLKGISSRLDSVFNNEKVVSSLVIDHGEFVKVSRTAPQIPAAAVASATVRKTA